MTTKVRSSITEMISAWPSPPTTCFKASTNCVPLPVWYTRARPIRCSLETESKVHLCREQNCPLQLMPTPGIHCKTYAVVDANGLVNLGAYAGWSARRLAVLFGRCLRRLLSGLHALIITDQVSFSCRGLEATSPS